jgi:SAM-dependent methyltransferase
MKKEIYPLTFELEETYWWYLGRRRIILDQVRSLFSKIRSGRPVMLDIGCGTGINLVEFTKMAEAYGLDASEDALRFCRQRGLSRLALQRIPSRSPNPNPFHKKYDLITMLDVLEHIPQDGQYLREISTWLTGNGCILLTVPAYPWLWSGEDHVSRHVRRYTSQALTRTVEQAGLVVEKISYFNTILFPGQALAILINNLFFPRSRTRTNLQKMPEGLNALLAGILSAESVLLKRTNLPFGGSILCICRKKQVEIKGK